MRFPLLRDLFPSLHGHALAVVPEGCFCGVRAARSCAALLAVWLSATVLWAAAPCVHFDVPEIVSCQPVSPADVGPESASESAPPHDSLLEDEMLVAARFSISTLVHVGREDELLQLLLVLESPQRSLHVVDYTPKTEMISLVTGEMEYQRQSERSYNAALNANLQGVPSVNGTASVGTQGKTSENVRYQQMPPLQLLAASGTIARGSAVYFKLRPSPRTSLEGNREFEVVFRVPRTWRADCVRLRCAAYDQKSPHGLNDREPVCGSTDFLVPLHLAGDIEARDAARQLALAERHLRQLARSHAERGQDRNDWTVKLTGWLLPTGKSKRGPVDQLMVAVLTSPLDQEPAALGRAMPRDLQQAVRNFVLARQMLYDLNTGAGEENSWEARLDAGQETR
jgi:hypothetical protein